MLELTEQQKETLGCRLHELRVERKMTAAGICEEVLGHAKGSHVAFSRLERGLLTKVKPEHLDAFAEFFEVTREMLFSTSPRPGFSGQSEKSVRDAKPAEAEPLNGSKKTPSLKTLPQRIEFLRSSHSMDATEFAQALSRHNALITTSDVQAWEADEKQPNAVQVRALTMLCDKTEAWLLGIDAPAPTVRAVPSAFTIPVRAAAPAK